MVGLIGYTLWVDTKLPAVIVVWCMIWNLGLMTIIGLIFGRDVTIDLLGKCDGTLTRFCTIRNLRNSLE